MDFNSFHAGNAIFAQKYATQGKDFAPLPINVDRKTHFFSLFSRPLTSMLLSRREKRSEASVRINIDEGGGGEIIENFTNLT